MLPPALSPAQIDPELLQESDRRLVEQQRAEPRRLDPAYDGGLAAQQPQAHHFERRLLRSVAVSTRHRRCAALHLPGAVAVESAPGEWTHRCHFVCAAQEECPGY